MTHQKQNIWSAGWRHWWENDSKKIEFQENPLLFILAVVDTIEPYKIYSSKAADRDAVRIWKSIDISFTNNTLTLSSRYKCRPITKIYERAKGLEAWVDIESIELSSDRKKPSYQI